MDYGEGSFWTSIFGLILQVIPLIPRHKTDRTHEQEEVLIALSEAYHLTNGYYAYLDEHSRNKEKEWQIADRWYRVGILLRKYDPHLANRLDLKSRYWREGATWSDKVIKEAKIGLSDVWREVNIRLP